jgi:hypothetical protein
MAENYVDICLDTLSNQVGRAATPGPADCTAARAAHFSLTSDSQARCCRRPRIGKYRRLIVRSIGFLRPVPILCAPDTEKPPVGRKRGTGRFIHRCHRTLITVMALAVVTGLVVTGGARPGSRLGAVLGEGVGGQVWRQQANGSLVNPQSGLCLSAAGVEIRYQLRCAILRLASAIREDARHLRPVAGFRANHRRRVCRRPWLRPRLGWRVMHAHRVLIVQNAWHTKPAANGATR